VSAEASNGHGGRPRPVAEAPVDALLARTEELARLWVLALVGVRPLEELAELPLRQIARIAPSLFDAALRALRSDASLTAERAGEGDETAAAGPQAGEGELRLMWEAAPREAVRAIEALRAVLWDALVYAAGAASLGHASGRLLRDLADRLAYVCSVVLERSLPAPAHVPEAAQRFEPAARRQTPPWVAPRTEGEPSARRASPPGQYARRPRSDAHREELPPTRPRAERPSAVLVDELVEARVHARPAGDADAARVHGAASPSGAGARTRRSRADGRALPWDIPLRGGGAGSEPASPKTRGVHDSAQGGWAGGGAPRAAADTPSISISRRRPPRERE
jgi:hypothetical protein